MERRYEEIRFIARGAAGNVHLYRRVIDDKLVIIKDIKMDDMSRDERQAALNEVKIHSMLHHPNIIEYYENFIEGQSLMIVMEYAPGGTLHDLLQSQNGQLLEEGVILHYLAQLLLSLHHIHCKQILHRDLKTQNILLDKKRQVIKISDFGISKVLATKSRASSVVGTPCYISPELCEGNDYNQKSDIWALGCVLYELVTLKKAFEATTLPALILRILRGVVAPIPDKYSDSLRQLLLSMLQIIPAQRPDVAQIMANPLLMNPILNLYTDLGAIPCTNSAASRPLPLSPRTLRARGKNGLPDAQAHRSSLGNIIISSVYFWGGGQLTPLKLPLPAPETVVTAVSAGRVQKVAVTKAGRLFVWESEAVGSGTLIPGVSVAPKLTPRYLEGQSAVCVQHVACGDLFTTCLTDRGILMTFGNGTQGCLGHGNLHDVSQPKIVEALLGFEVVQVSCGTSHVLAVTNDHELFAWGRGDSGRLGLGEEESVLRPRQVPVPATRAAFAGVDGSLLVTVEGELMAAGSNRYNKLGLDCPGQPEVEEAAGFLAVSSPPLPSVQCACAELGTNHTAVLTKQGELITFGSNQFGQLGHKGLPRTPGVVELPGSCVLVGCGDAFTCAVLLDGSIWTWGKGQRGRLGRTDDDVVRPGMVRLPETGSVEAVSLASQGWVSLLAIKVTE